MATETKTLPTATWKGLAVWLPLPLPLSIKVGRWPGDTVEVDGVKPASSIATLGAPTRHTHGSLLTVMLARNWVSKCAVC